MSIVTGQRRVSFSMDTAEAEPVTATPALVMIDEALSLYAARSLVDADEVSDLLLDLRRLVAPTN